MIRKRMTFIAVAAALLAGSVVAKEMVRTPADAGMLAEVEQWLVDALIKPGERDASLADVNEQDRFRKLVEKHDLKLFGGPMLGCVTDTSARFWVRTPAEADVQVVLSSQPDLADPVRSETVRTNESADLTALIDVTGLEPFTQYHYDVLVDGNSALAPDLPSFRTYPSQGQPAKFDVGFGGGARYIHEKERIWDTIASFDPAAFLFLGDNLYIDQPRHRNAQRVYYYRRQLRPEFRRLSASTALYAIWDDHDFGDNDCEGGPDPFKPDWKLPVWRVFTENWNNPYYGGGEEQPGCWFDFSIGDVDFFMTDGRYYRVIRRAEPGERTMLGPAQKEWLLSRLKASDAAFKVIASGTLWTKHADKGGRDSWWGARQEREEILSLIEREKIGGVILLSADRHRTDVYRIERPVGYPLYEFETSKLTNNHTHGTRKEAVFSYNKGNFFGMLTFDFTRDDPELTFRCITIDKEPVYSLTLKHSELQPE